MWEKLLFFAMTTSRETVQKRLNVYHEQTQPLIDYYTEQGVLKTVDGTRSLDEVFQEIVGVFKENKKCQFQLSQNMKIEL